MKAGDDPDEIVRRQLGFEEKGDLTETQEQYVLKAKAKLEEVRCNYCVLLWC